VISYKDNETAKYDKLLGLARAAGDKDAIDKLDAALAR